MEEKESLSIEYLFENYIKINESNEFIHIKEDILEHISFSKITELIKYAFDKHDKYWDL